MTIRRKQQLKRRRKFTTPANTARRFAAMEKAEKNWARNFGIHVRFLP